jgi:hypothetical protein
MVKPLRLIPVKNRTSLFVNTDKVYKKEIHSNVNTFK